MIRRACFVAALLVAGSWSGTSGAQAVEKDADAERLFREGQKLLQDRRYGEACPKFEAAYAKDHQLGTLLNLAYCHKEQGAIWVAWLEFKEAEVRAVELKRTDRRDFARQRMAELEKSLSRAVVDRPAKIDLSEVLVDDRRVLEAEKGVAFAIEPGQRKLTFRAKGKKEVVQMVTIAKADRPQHVTAPSMEEDEPPPPVVVAPAPEPPKPLPVQRVDETSSGSPQKTLAFALGAVGIAGLAVGTVTGIMTLSNDCAGAGKEGTPSCPGHVQDKNGNPTIVDSASQDKVSKAETTGTISTVGFVVGGGLLAGAVILYLTAPHGKPAAPSDARAVHVVPDIGAGWAGLHGTF